MVGMQVRDKDRGNVLQRQALIAKAARHAKARIHDDTLSCEGQKRRGRHGRPASDRRPALGEKIGTITLESLDLSWPIFEGTEDAQLAKGVGHYRKSVLPGVEDNTILSGHRSTVFNRLGELKKNDLIYVKTKAGVFTYRVRGFRVVDRSDRTVIMPTETAVLTLTTCYPFNHIGITTDAFIVTADLIESALKPTSTK
jgi:sortase A